MVFWQKKSKKTRARLCIWKIFRIFAPDLYECMGRINKEILRLAVPSILANITIPLVGVVDTAIVGHLSDAAAIGGIAIGTMLFDLLYWNFGFLRVGTSGLTAQAYGAGGDCRKLLTQSVTTALIGALFVWAIQWLFVTAVLAVVPCSAAVAAVAREYFFVRIWAAPATLMLMAFKGWFIGMQDTTSPMAVDILVNVVNMVTSYLLAVYTPAGIIGVAYGTLIAQYSGLLLAILIVTFKYAIVHIGLREIIDVMRWTELQRMMALNGNLFIRSLCFMVVYVGFAMLISKYGDVELAVGSIMMKLFMLFSFFVDGFAYAGEALVGKAYGEKVRGLEIRDIVRALFGWAIGVGVIFTVLYALWGDESIALMTSDAAVQTAAHRYIGWLIAMPLVSTLAFMWDGIYVGATEGVKIRNSMIHAAWAFVVAYLLCYHACGAQALYIAYFAHLIARVIYLTIHMKKIFVISMLCAVVGLFCTGCQDQVQQAAGTYSYKISGKAVVDGDERTLTNETGALDIVHKDSENALLTFNALGGAAYTTNATIADKRITLTPYERVLTIGSKDYTVMASGDGDIYDGTIVITLKYKSSNVTANSLTLLCKRNQ